MNDFMDIYGRIVRFSTNGETDTYTAPGITVQFPAGTPRERAEYTFSGMAPAESSSETHVKSAH